MFFINDSVWKFSDGNFIGVFIRERVVIEFNKWMFKWKDLEGLVSKGERVLMFSCF